MRERTLTLLDETGLGAGTTTGDTFACGLAKRLTVTQAVANAATDAGDTLDTYVDVSIDGATWINVAHFTQKIGTDADAIEVAVLDPANPGTDVFDVTTDCAAGKTRPSVVGNFVRARAVVVDADADGSFDVQVLALIQE